MVGDDNLKRTGNLEVIDCQLGRIEFSEEEIILFPEGIYGYEQDKQYLIVRDKRFFPFQWLVSVCNPQLMFPVIDPLKIISNYDPPIKNQHDLNSKLVIVTIGENIESVTANLRAPLLISFKNGKGKQVILTDTQYPLRHQVTN